MCFGTEQFLGAIYGLFGDMFVVYSGTFLQTLDLNLVTLTIINFAMALLDFNCAAQPGNHDVDVLVLGVVEQHLYSEDLCPWRV